MKLRYISQYLKYSTIYFIYVIGQLRQHPRQGNNNNIPFEIMICCNIITEQTDKPFQYRCI